MTLLPLQDSAADTTAMEMNLIFPHTLLSCILMAHAFAQSEPAPTYF